MGVSGNEPIPAFLNTSRSSRCGEDIPNIQKSSVLWKPTKLDFDPSGYFFLHQSKGPFDIFRFLPRWSSVCRLSLWHMLATPNTFSMRVKVDNVWISPLITVAGVGGFQILMSLKKNRLTENELPWAPQPMLHCWKWSRILGLRMSMHKLTQFCSSCSTEFGCTN